MSWAMAERPYPRSSRWGSVVTKAHRHSGLARSTHGASLYIHRVRGVWLQWSPDSRRARFGVGWECSADGSLDAHLLPPGTSPTCPICVVNERAACMGAVPGLQAVYYARGEDGLIKIGTSLNVGARLNSLGAELIAAERASGLSDELRRHRQFAHLRVRGEWFRSAPDLIAHIETLAAAS